MQQFTIDGNTYNVHVLELTRSFVIEEESSQMKTLDGEIHRDPLGTYYNYEMTVMEKDGDRAAMDALFDILSQPAKSHVCVFPYNQKTLAQRMFIRSGGQALRRLHKNGAEWDSITVQFVAKSPRVVP